MNLIRKIKYKIMKFLGMSPKLSDVVLNNLKEKQAEQEGYVPEPTPITKKCGYSPCKKKLTGLVYKCKYCKGTFCERHRLPENHDCEDPKLPREMRIGSGIRKLSENRFSEAMREEN